MAVTYDFINQTAIVTGGARGIGRAIAEQLAISGAEVWIWDIDPIELTGTHSVAVDVTNADSKRLDAIPGFGVILSTAVVATMTDPKAFRTRRPTTRAPHRLPLSHQSMAGGRNTRGVLRF